MYVIEVGIRLLMIGRWDGREGCDGGSVLTGTKRNGLR